MNNKHIFSFISFLYFFSSISCSDSESSTPKISQTSFEQKQIPNPSTPQSKKSELSAQLLEKQGGFFDTVTTTIETLTSNKTWIKTVTGLYKRGLPGGTSHLAAILKINEEDRVPLLLELEHDSEGAIERWFTNFKTQIKTLPKHEQPGAAEVLATFIQTEGLSKKVSPDTRTTINNIMLDYARRSTQLRIPSRTPSATDLKE